MAIDRDGDGPPLRRSDNRPAGERGDDLRAQPFTDDVFGEYHARRKSAANSFGLIAGIVIGIAAVGGLGWYMYTRGMLAMSGTGGSPQLVKADTEPYKVKPDNPGGMQVENQDKLVYDRVARGEAPARVENLLPPPEEPNAPPRPAPAEAAPPQPSAPEASSAMDKPAAPATPPASSSPAQQAAPPAAAPSPPSTPEAARAEAPKPPAPAAAPAPPGTDPLAAAVSAATGGRESATGPIAGTTPPVQTAEAPAPPAPPATAGTASGAFQVQLASARSEEGAMSEWKRISGKNQEAFAGLSPAVARVDLADKGIFFRLRAGPLPDRAAAEALCARLSAQNIGCIVVRP